MSDNKSRPAASSCVESGRPVRTLTLFDGISTILSLMVGSGIFSTAGESQNDVGSPGLNLIMMAVSGLLALTGALCYAELGTMIPGSGGEGQYLTRAFGPMMTFLFNWTSILILKPGTVAILATATGKYLLRLVFAIGNMPNDTLGGASRDWTEKGIAMGVCLMVTLAASLSTKWSNRIQGILTFGKIGALAFVILSGLYFAIFHNSTIIKSNLGNAFEGSIWSISGLAMALNNGLWSFDGWNNLNIVAGDLANPAVNLPLSIWISMVAVVVLYLLTLVGYYAVLPKAVVAITETIGVEFGFEVVGKFGLILMPILIASSTFGSALSSMVTSSEIIVLAAKSRQVPSYFQKISPTFNTAARAYWLQGLLAMALVCFANFQGLLVIYTFPMWIFYAACVLVLLLLRYKEPNLERPYRVFLSTPILFLVSCLVLFASSAAAKPIPIGLSVVVVLLGIPLYFVLRRSFGLGLSEDEWQSRKSRNQAMKERYQDESTSKLTSPTLSDAKKKSPSP